MHTTKLSVLVWGLGLLLGTSCSDANFVGASGSDDPKGKPTRNSGNVSEGAHLTWLWPCGDVNSEPRIENDEVILSGPGPHTVASNGLDGTVVKIKGSACNISASRRNVVFVIDVSGSMEDGGIFDPPGNDPLTNGSCGRLEAVQEVISSITSRGNATFGIATFADNTVGVSSQMFAREADLYDDLLASSGASSLADVLCSGVGGTNYNAGLQSAEDLLADYASDEELTEIYFISDGQPNEGQDGAVLAADLRDNGTLIGTVMVGDDDDSVLKNDIASKDNHGAPFHSRVDSSSELANVLARLADNQVAQGVMRYSNNQGEVGNLDFTGKFAGTSFAFDAFELNLEELPNGLMLELIIKDRFGEEEKKSGELIWASD